MFTHNDNGHPLGTVGRSGQHLTRLNLKEPWKTLLLQEQIVPTHWTDFAVLMGRIEKQVGIKQAGLPSFLSKRSTD